ncbi:hypothetical protein A3B60_02150 [Candidatus Peregrinibacteria bacterium RIFCSPLOWO2_01_FULL_39_12]|nr:MAG: hypothetical protein A3B60_02150 [Candidatus Peregrinibacteria bacterium RIFCSPLOWO2_01_FULL_39_12]OGJ42757.1 MAG: hypothetical protein A3I58_01015 [Candidatus Peregrinibacteria bacterium RIFCSPLOWO2_02_FULL_39_10]
MGTQGQQTSPMETLQRTKADRESASNLSETARLVNGTLRKYVYPKLRGGDILDRANEISRIKPASDDPKVVGFIVDCKQFETEILQEAKGQGLDSKGETVIKNFFAKLVNMARTAHDFATKIEIKKV